MIPLRDNLQTLRFPIMTAVLIAINIAVFIWQLNFPTQQQLDIVGTSSIDQSSLRYGAMPYRLTHPSHDDCFIGATDSAGDAEIVCEGSAEAERAQQRGAHFPGLEPIPIDQPPWYLTILTSMFMHGGILHIAFNMLFLWVFGPNVEDSMGRARFVGFYLLAGLAAVYSQSLLDPSSTVPTIGASGAIAGVLGGYALLYPRARVMTLVFIIFLITFVEIPALALLAAWFALQFLPALGQFATPDVAAGGVAYFAHVGGFIFGLALIKLFALRRAGPMRSRAV